MISDIIEQFYKEICFDNRSVRIKRVTLNKQQKLDLD